MSDRAEQWFKWIWRANGVLLLVLCVGGLLVLGSISVDFGVVGGRARPQGEVTEVAGTHLGELHLRLGDFSEVAGTSFLYAPLGEEAYSRGVSSSGYAAQDRNLLFFDARTQKTHWLLEGNGETIRTRTFLVDPPACEYRDSGSAKCAAPRVTIALLLELESGQSTDQQATGARRLAIAAADGTGVSELVSGITGLRGVHQMEGARAIVFYSKAGTVRVLDVDLRTRTVVSDNALAAQQ